MAITAAPFAFKNLGLDAEPLRQAVSSLVANTGGVVQQGDLAVTQTGTPSLGVLVGVGRAWMPGTNTANLAGQTYSTQAQYFATNDAPVTVNLATANATNPRIDVIYIGVVDTFYGGGSNVIKIDKVTGTPAGSPTVPALPANSIALANVAVAANATSVTNANITARNTQMVRPSAIIVPPVGVHLGTGTTLTADFANNKFTPIIQTATVVITTDASGYFGIDYSKPFPNGIISQMLISGDATVGRGVIISAAGAPFTQSLSTMFGSAWENGSAKANTNIRIEYIVYGW